MIKSQTLLFGVLTLGLGFASIVLPEALDIDERFPSFGMLVASAWLIMLLLFGSGFLMGVLDPKRFHLWGIILLLAPSVELAVRMVEAGDAGNLWPIAFFIAGFMGLPAWGGAWAGARAVGKWTTGSRT